MNQFFFRCRHHSQAILPVAGLGLWGKQEAVSRSQNESNKRPSTLLVPAATTSMMGNAISPTLPIRIIRPNPNLEIAFDVRTRNPIYVLERLDRTNRSRRVVGRRPNFYEEASLPENYRSRPSHYRGSGWDRGHMAPAADFPDSPHDTFTLCNVSPQDHYINITIWNRLEEWVRRVANDDTSDGCETYVVTGPLWLPTRQVQENKFEYSHLGLGRPPSLVWVPTHFFKVVVVVEKHVIRQYACFVVENRSSSSTTTSNTTKKKALEDYLVPWTDLETVTGLQFFPNWATDEWKDQADRITRDEFFTDRPTSQRLLTDGSTTPRPRQRGRRKMPADNKMGLIHLCMGGKCQ